MEVQRGEGTAFREKGKRVRWRKRRPPCPGVPPPCCHPCPVRPSVMTAGHLPSRATSCANTPCGERKGGKWVEAPPPAAPPPGKRGFRGSVRSLDLARAADEYTSARAPPELVVQPAPTPGVCKDKTSRFSKEKRSDSLQGPLGRKGGDPGEKRGSPEVRKERESPLRLEIKKRRRGPLWRKGYPLGPGAQMEPHGGAPRSHG